MTRVRPAPLFLRSNGTSPEQIRALFESHTIDSMAAAAGVTDSAVKRWEVIYEARCRRVCLECRAVVPYEAMSQTKSGAVRYCVECHERLLRRASMTDRELMAEELRVPMAQWARRVLARRMDGINGWLWAQGGIA